MTYDQSNLFYAGGGGASHIAAIQSSLEYRIIVAGVAGGSYFHSGLSVAGGMGGGERGSDSSAECDAKGSGMGASQTKPGTECANMISGCAPGSFGTGGSLTSHDGSGGGGGWFGGSSAYDNCAGGGGGSGFVFEGKTGTNCPKIDSHPLLEQLEPLTNAETKAGINPSSGIVKITCIQLSETAKSCNPHTLNDCPVVPSTLGVIRMALLLIEVQ